MNPLLKKWICVLPLFSIIFLLSCTSSSHNKNAKFSNFLKAIKNSSTFSYFTVVTVKNLNTGEVKQICTKGNFVSGALHMELNADYDNKGERKVLRYAKKRKDRYFELSNKKALENISFFDYDETMLAEVKKEYDIDQLVATIENEHKLDIRLPDDEMRALAHILFNKGYLTGENNCFGGTLQYVTKDLAKMIDE
jgi:hypothetical protein